MGAISVTTNPQAIYPDGDQDSFVIRNNGPYTVYVDSDSSVSVNNSHPIPPTGVMAWDAYRPLWIVGAGQATVTLTRNSTAAVFTNAVTSLLYQNASFTLPNGLTTDVFECSAYSTLMLNIASSDMQVGYASNPGNSIYDLIFTWYDSLGNILGSDNVEVMAQSARGGFASPATRIQIPVRGAACAINVNSYFGSGIKRVALKVIGSTLKLPFRATFLQADTMPHYIYSIGVDPNGTEIHGIDSFYCNDIAVLNNVPTYEWPAAIILPAIGPVLQWVLTLVPAVTTAGQMYFGSMAPGGTFIRMGPTIAIPVSGASQVLAGTINVPLGYQIGLAFAPAPLNGGVPVHAQAALNIQWKQA